MQEKSTRRDLVEGEGRGAVADAGRAGGRRVGGNPGKALLISPVESWARDAESGGDSEQHQTTTTRTTRFSYAPSGATELSGGRSR